MKCDLAIGEVKESWKSGMISFKLSVNNKSQNGSVYFRDFDAWKKPPPKRLSSWKIRAYIY